MIDIDKIRTQLTSKGLKEIKAVKGYFSFKTDNGEGMDIDVHGYVKTWKSRDMEKVYSVDVSETMKRIVSEIDTSQIPTPKKNTTVIPEIVECGVKDVGGENRIVETGKKTIIVKQYNESEIDHICMMYQIPREVQNLFFCIIQGALYIKQPGLLYIAGKKGYSAMQLEQHWDDTAKEWVCEYKIYPTFGKKEIDAISQLTPALQETAIDCINRPTIGIGRAGQHNVKKGQQSLFLQEMAQTRAQCRALRAYTGYGGCSEEELGE